MLWTARALVMQAAASATVIRCPSDSPLVGVVGVHVMSPATMSESPRTVTSTGGEVEVDGGGWLTWAARAGAQSTTQASNSPQVTISARR